MDELDLLKKDWQNEENNDFPKLGFNDIYKMILKKSSSIVKWIFIISLMEFVFWLLLSLVIKTTNVNDKISDIESNGIYITLIVITYIGLAYFFYKFYINYKNINTTDNATKLMENILKTRRTVKHYVAFNLIAIVVSVVVMLPIYMNTDPETKNLLDTAAANGDLFKYYAGMIIATLVMLTIAVAILLLFYWLIYGILLKRLNHNYNELKKLEV